MRQVALVVEGPTEEQFVNRVLSPWARSHDTYLEAIVVKTSRSASGSAFRGGGRWRNFERDIRGLLRASHLALVTTLIDFYGYPPDAPGAQCQRPHQPRECASFRESEMAQAIDHRRFLPNVVLHEFETWVIAAVDKTGELVGDTSVVPALQRAVAEAGGDVELVDDSPTTSPSKRIAATKPDFLKTSEGIAAIENAGIDQVAAARPRLQAWLDRLVTTGSS